MVCSRWPEPRKNKNKQKKNCRPLQTTCPQSQTRAPMGSAVLFLCFCWFFEVFAWFAPDGQNLEKQKKQYNQNCRPHVHRVRQEPQWGLQFCFFCFFDVFAWFAPDGQNLEKPKNKTADHMSTESDKSPNGVCSFVFFVFLSFSRFLHGLLQMARTSKKQKNKTNKPADHMSTESDKSPNGVCSFVFFCFFEVFAWFAPDGQNLEKTKKQNCRPHVHRVRQEPQWGLQFCLFVPHP